MDGIEGKRILVTGATGQVAGHLTEQLARKNEVHAAARFTDAKAKAELESKGVRTVYFSMGEAELSSLPDVDYVFHCGCNTSPKSPEIGMAQNAEGTGFLMQRYRTVRAFFHMSSSSVYRVPASKREPTKETDMLGGFSNYGPHYAMSKLATEAVVRFQARALNLPTVIARLDVAYGRRGHGGVPMALYEMMKHGAAYTRAASGESFCSPIHEEDIARQAERLILKAAVPAPIVNLGGDEAVSVEEMIRYVEALTGLTMKVDVADEATWGMKVLDATLRQQLAGPCEVAWRDGVRRALAARHPDAIRNPDAR
ncbi:NAD(P)-dependent oxidoreductase [Myxococcota bacterium]|nr:NAD(P)-dependent oxidoreductase [Myxococcota bacterium]